MLEKITANSSQTYQSRDWFLTREEKENGRKTHQIKRQLKRVKKPTSEISEEIVTDVSGSLRAAVAIVNSYKGTKLTGLNLTLVFKHEIGLNDRHRKLPRSVLTGIPEPEQPILTFFGEGPKAIAAAFSVAVVASVVVPQWVPA